MLVNVLARRLDALHGLARRLTDERAGGLLGEGLDVMLSATAARACVAFAIDGTVDPVAERGLLARAGYDASSIKRVLHRLASHAATTRRTLLVLDARRELADVHEAAELSAAGIRALQVEPVLHHRSVLAVLVTLFDETALLDEPTRIYTSAVAAVLALGLENERRAEQERAERERFSTSTAPGVGLLTSAVAQELKAPATALALQWEELGQLIEQVGQLSGPSDGPLGVIVNELGELAQEMGAALGRLRETTDRLQAMGKRESTPEHVDISSVARRAIVAARTLLDRRGIPLDERYEADCVTLGRRDELEQVVLNLLLNALEAATGSEKPKIWLRVQADTKHVSLVVEDTGPGVPADQLENIFQPFFTTKAQGRGAGLGLKIVSEVVAAHGGHIEVHERRGGGASFRVVLPRVSSPPGAVLQSPLPQREGPAVRRVFVVDDDPLFSRSLRRGLKPHDVRTAASASEAEMVLLDPNYYPDLVVCDVFLPGAHGDVLHQRIKAKRPDMAARFVFVTGAALAKDEATYLKLSGCPTLLKPVDLVSLRAMLGPREQSDSAAPISVRTLSSPADSDLPTAIPPGER